MISLKKKSAKLILIVLIIFQFACNLIASSSSSPKTPPSYGVFFLNDGDYVEIPQGEGVPYFGDSGFVAIENKEPTIIIWNPNIDLANLTLNILDTQYTSIDYDIKPLGEDLYELKPAAQLELDVYCLIQGNPALSSVSLSVWCFEITDSAISNANPTETTTELFELWMDIPDANLGDKAINHRLVAFDPSGKILYIWVEYLEENGRRSKNEALFSFNIQDKTINKIVSFEDPLHVNDPAIKEDEISISSDGRYVTIYLLRDAKMIDVNTGEVRLFHIKQASVEVLPVVMKAGWLPNTENNYAVFYGGVIGVYDPFSEEILKTVPFDVQQGKARAFFWNFDGTKAVLDKIGFVATVYDSNFVLIRDIDLKKENARVIGWYGKDNLIAFRQDDDTYFIVDSNTGEQIKQFQLDKISLFPNPTDKLLVGSEFDSKKEYKLVVVSGDGATLQQTNINVYYRFGEWNAKGDVIVLVGTDGDIHIWKMK